MKPGPKYGLFGFLLLSEIFCQVTSLPNQAMFMPEMNLQVVSHQVNVTFSLLLKSILVRALASLPHQLTHRVGVGVGVGIGVGSLQQLCSIFLGCIRTWIIAKRETLGASYILTSVCCQVLNFCAGGVHGRQDCVLVFVVRAMKTVLRGPCMTERCSSLFVQNALIEREKANAKLNASDQCSLSRRPARRRRQWSVLVNAHEPLPHDAPSGPVPQMQCCPVHPRRSNASFPQDEPPTATVLSLPATIGISTSMPPITLRRRLLTHCR